MATKKHKRTDEERFVFVTSLTPDDWRKMVDRAIDNRDKCLKCDDCGKQDETVVRGTCPYQDEINNRTVPADLCPDCYSDRILET